MTRYFDVENPGLCVRVIHDALGKAVVIPQGQTVQAVALADNTVERLEALGEDRTELQLSEVDAPESPEPEAKRKPGRPPKPMGGALKMTIDDTKVHVVKAGT